MKKPKECFRTRVGGQALIEGIMMRGPEKICVAVRKPDGTIDLMMDQVKHHPWSKIPFLRGGLNMVENLVLGYRYLMHSADVSLEDEEEEEPSKLERWLQDHLGAAFEKALMGAASVLGVVLALVLFMALPAFCVKTLGRFVESRSRLLCTRFYNDPEDFRSRSYDRSYSGGDLWNLFHNEI